MPADPWAPPAEDGGPRGGLAPYPTTPSLHDQRTMTSFPGASAPPPWTAPAADPFAPPGAPVPPYGAADPFAPPAAGTPYGPGPGVPPPPVGPDGPGRVPPYGYPGYPGGPGHPYPGAQPYGYYGWPGAAPGTGDGMGTAGLVLGIIAAVGFCLWPLAIVVGVLGVVFGAIGRGKARRGEAGNPGQALAGVICGAAGIVLGLAFGALVIFVP
ncbi:hypothetical protein [Streptomyces sp. SHP 1-2]|uniref:hypothetical protein n=1 Tax=Streptomyces sp. SHP 1-2 TaxID=2769489 RepID=UPI0022375160|nr:hypothetical protein [Streptomyces sp. SHP 1-2]